MVTSVPPFGVSLIEQGSPGETPPPDRLFGRSGGGWAPSGAGGQGVVQTAVARMDSLTVLVLVPRTTQALPLG